MLFYNIIEISLEQLQQYMTTIQKWWKGWHNDCWLPQER